MNISHHVMHYLFIGIGILLFMYSIIIFNNLISLKNNVKKALANIDVLLKQRHDELPKLIQTCQQYMQYERDTLQKITDARAKSMQAIKDGNIKELGAAEGLLRGGLGNLFALAENYPALKADETFVHLQTRISDLENNIADRRELYNQNVTQNNIRIEQFPDILIAKTFRFKPFETLDFDQAELSDINVSSQFKS